MARIDTDDWAPFAIGDLFDAKKGKRLTRAQMKPGKVRFIGASAKNNGCTAMVGNVGNIHPANTLTVCYNGSVRAAFFQDEPYLASDDVVVLYPKFAMTREIALFFIPLIKAAGARYDYVDKWRMEVMVMDEILLPTDNSGKPDWNHIEAYMLEIIEQANNAISELTRIWA